MLVTRLCLVGGDATQCLIEPAAYSVVAVMDVAALTIPMLPGEVCAVVQHIEVAWVFAFLEHIVHLLRLGFACSPLCNYRHTHKTCRQVSLVDILGVLPQCLLHSLYLRFWGRTHKHRVYQINLCASRIALLLWVEEGLMYERIMLLVLGAVDSCVGTLAQCAGNLRHCEVALRHHAVVHHINRKRCCLVNASGCCPVAQIPVAILGYAPVFENSILHITLGEAYPSLHMGVETLHHTHITIVQVVLPRGYDYELAPEWTTTRADWVGGCVRHIARLALAVAPGCQPVEVER